MDDSITETEQRILANLRVSFIDSSLLKLAELSDLIKIFPTTESSPEWKNFLEEIHVLKGMGGTFGFRNFSQIARRLELYFEDGTDAEHINVADVETYLKKLNDCLLQSEHPDQKQLDAMISTLPTRNIGQ
jgi:chemotaxis protein histidine kinase CheA